MTFYKLVEWLLAYNIALVLLVLGFLAWIAVRVVMWVIDKVRELRA